MSNISDYGDFKAWCKMQGLPMPVSDAEDEDKAETLILNKDQTAERAEWTAEWPIVPVEPLDSDMAKELRGLPIGDDDLLPFEE